MTRVNVSNRNSDTAPKSLSVYRAVSRPPAAAAGQSSGAVVRRKERNGPSPSVRATSSKAGSTWDGAVVEQVTTEYQQGLAVKKTQAFRAYSGYEAAFKDYAALLQRRYPQAAAAGAAADEFAAGLVAGGYATDPAYADKVQRLIAQLA